MRYLTDKENILIDEFVINVNMILNIENLTFACKDEDTINSLKVCISSVINFHPLEQVLMVGADFPYPLVDNLLLSHLLDNHRNLNLIVSENPEKITPSRLISTRYKTYMTDKDIPKIIVLNLQNIEENDIQHISKWIFSERFKIVEIDWNNPHFYKIMKNIVDALNISLYERPSDLSKIVFYNKDITTKEHSDSFIYFGEKLKKYRCYDKIKFIDYSNRTFFSL